MQRELIPSTQSTLFDELPNGQRTLFNGIPPKRGRNPACVAPSTLELIGDEIDRHCAERRFNPVSNISRKYHASFHDNRPLR
jgi:hypothetical protein